MNTTREQTSASRMAVLMFTDLVNSSGLTQELGDDEYARSIAAPHDHLFRDVLSQFPNAEVNKHTGDGFLVLFQRVDDAVNAALLFHHALRAARWKDRTPQTRIGIHLGQITLLMGEDEPVIVADAANMCARLMSLGVGGQTLLTGEACVSARQYVRDHPPHPDGTPAPKLLWLKHGRYEFQGAKEPYEVYEVGGEGVAPLRAPGDSEKARRVDSEKEQETLGWRPAPGQAVPGQTGWILEQMLGEGGFGEVWLARRQKIANARVFKFCFDAVRLASLRRELKLSQVIQAALGDRDDIVRLLDHRLDTPPFYLESEYVQAGNLQQWLKRRSEDGPLPLETRIAVVAQVARTVAAAHSLTIIHRDLKPSNIFIHENQDGSPRPMLADFGIGVLLNRDFYARHDITDAALTAAETSSQSGTRMYAPPETLQGKPATTATDVYALGVLLYQMVVDDLSKPLAVGWENDVDDELLREDIRLAVMGDPAERLATAAQLADRLESLDDRRAKLERRRREAIARREAERQAADSARRVRTLRRGLVFAVAALCAAAVAIFLVNRAWRQEQEARQQSEEMIDFMIHLFEGTDPMGLTGLRFRAYNYRARERPLSELISTGRDRLRQSSDLPDAAKTQIEHILSRIETAAAKRTMTGEQFLLEAAEVIPKRFERNASTRARLQSAIGNALRGMGSFDDSKKMLQSSLDICREHFGDDSLETAAACQDLAGVLRDIGEYERGKRLYEQALDVRSARLGTAHALTDETRVHFAWLLVENGKLEQAGPLFEIAIRNRGEAGDAERQAFAEAAFAAALLEAGRGNEAEPHFIAAVNLFGESSELAHFAQIFQEGTIAVEEGDWKTAVDKLSECFDRTKDTLDEDHPYTIWARSQYAWALWRQGTRESDLKLAEREALSALRSAEATSLGNHPKIARLHSIIALIYFDLGDYDKAEGHMRQSMRINELRFGCESEKYASDLLNLAQLHTSQNKYAEAEELNRQAVGILEKLDQVELALAFALTQSGNMLFNRIGAGEGGSLDDAAALATRALDLLAEANVTDDPLGVTRADQRRHVAEAALTLGRCRYEQKKYAEALHQFQEAYQRAAFLYPSDFRKTLSGLVSVHKALGRPEDAKRFQSLLDEDQKPSPITSGGAS